MKTHYEVLGVRPTSDRESVRHAYVVAARRHHPDAGGDPAAMRAVNEAWTVLADPDRRARYDEVIGVERSPIVDAATETGPGLPLDADLPDDDDDGTPAAPRASTLDVASLLAVIALGFLAAFSLLFGMVLTIGELLGLGVFLAHQAFADLPAILETPGPEGHGPDAEEVRRLRALHARATADAAPTV